jgi:hypothetical protein
MVCFHSFFHLFFSSSYTWLALPSYLDSPLCHLILKRSPCTYYFYRKQKGSLILYDHLRGRLGRSLYRAQIQSIQPLSFHQLSFIPRLPTELMQRVRKNQYLCGDCLDLAIHSPAHRLAFLRRSPLVPFSLHPFFNWLLKRLGR